MSCINSSIFIRIIADLILFLLSCSEVKTSSSNHSVLRCPVPAATWVPLLIAAFVRMWRRFICVYVKRRRWQNLFPAGWSPSRPTPELFDLSSGEERSQMFTIISEYISFYSEIPLSCQQITETLQSSASCLKFGSEASSGAVWQAGSLWWKTLSRCIVGNVGCSGSGLFDPPKDVQFTVIWDN